MFSIVFSVACIFLTLFELSSSESKLTEENMSDLSKLIEEHLDEETPAKLSKIRVYDSEDSIRIILFPDREIKFRYNLLPGKENDSVYIDLLNTEKSRLKTPELKKESFLKKIRFGKQKDALRVVLDTGKVEGYNVSVMEAPWRIIVDYYGKKTKTAKTEKKRKSEKESFVLVVDPGHGGKDPGAVSGNIQEKDVVLQLAKIIRRIAEKEYDIEVKLTRDKDIYIPLDKRAIIANRLDGDLFISIHANAFPSSDISGVEVYHLDNRQSEYVNKLAMVENKVSKKNSLVNTILVDMTMSFYIDDSLLFANYIGKNLKRALPPYKVNMRGYKKGALFYVLVGARMPSLLFEAGFISNPHERKLLQKKSYLETLARSILEGVKKIEKKLP
ncbi:MAG: N-acetylmuramoyl-L-alanine amidase [bacterium]